MKNKKDMKKFKQNSKFKIIKKYFFHKKSKYLKFFKRVNILLI